MDRVAKLAAEAHDCIIFESICDFSPEAARAATRGVLADIARSLGFPENEISAAIDTALGGR